MRIPNQIRDLLLYVLIGVTLAAVALWMGVYNFEHHLHADTSRHFFAAAVFSCFVFGYLINDNRNLWRERKVWILWIVFLMSHLSVWTYYLLGWASSARVPVGAHAIVAFVEIFIFSALTQFFVDHSKRNPQ